VKNDQFVINNSFLSQSYWISDDGIHSIAYPMVFFSGYFHSHFLTAAAAALVPHPIKSHNVNVRK